MNFVLDASLALAWFFKDEATAYTNGVLRALEDARALVPSIWFYEVNNAIVTGLRARRTTEQKVNEFVDLLTELPIDVHPTPPLAGAFAGSIRELALREKLSAYDASYVALASEVGLGIATLDGAGKRVGMKQAAQRCGVALFEVPGT